MFSIVNIITMGIGLFFLIVWLFIFMKSKKYDSMFETLNEKEYPLKELFSTGYALIELVGYDYKGKRDRKMRQEIDILYGQKYAEFYLRVVYSQQITYCMLLILLGFVLYGLVNEIGVLFIMFLFAGVAFYYYGTLIPKKINKRSEQLLTEFSEAIAKLALLTNAGMILREAWEEIAQGGEGVFFEEMKISVEDMNNGISEVEAIRLFGIRCIIPEIKKFSSTIIQGLTKGNKELANMLQEQSKEVWAEKKQRVRRQGEKAASKLLIPILIMFIGILIMVIVPIFTNMGI